MIVSNTFNISFLLKVTSKICVKSVYKMDMDKLIVLWLLIAVTDIQSARILGVFPTPSISHQVVFRAYTSELVKRGHELVVLTTDPLYRNKTAPANLKEIDLGSLYGVFDVLTADPTWDFLKRGAIMVSDDWLKPELDPFFLQSAAIFQFKEVTELINDKKQKFDLIIVESLSYLPLVFCEIFQAPAILISSFYGFPRNYEIVGAVARHPILYPHSYRTKFRNLNVFGKIAELHREWKYYNFDIGHENNVNNFIKTHFRSLPPVSELKKHVSMFFVNSHPVFNGNRPSPPGVLYLNALHLQPVKDLPQDLKAYLDNSKRGVIYVSLGTNVRPSYMAPELLNTFLDAFEALPFDILWKFDGDSLERLPKNVKIQKWFPQRDVLVHPNIKLFVTQGGLQSFDEAVDAAVPLVGIPFLGDQWHNVDKFVELDIGVALDVFKFNATDLIKAVNNVMNDKRYKENMLKLRNIVNDQPEKPLDRAVWWTEYVIRHKGSRHLLSKSADMSWSEYLMTDVLIALAVILTIVVSIISLFLYCVIRSIKRMVKIKKD